MDFLEPIHTNKTCSAFAVKAIENGITKNIQLEIGDIAFLMSIREFAITFKSY